MTLKEAISILASHQKWRLGDENTPMTVPSELTDAIATILDHIGDTNKMPELSDEEIETLRHQYFKENGIWSDKTDYFIKGAKWYREQLKKKQ